LPQVNGAHVLSFDVLVGLQHHLVGAGERGRVDEIAQQHATPAEECRSYLVRPSDPEIDFVHWLGRNVVRLPISAAPKCGLLGAAARDMATD
jgi:hypothetical protein